MKMLSKFLLLAVVALLMIQSKCPFKPKDPFAPLDACQLGYYTLKKGYSENGQIIVPPLNMNLDGILDSAFDLVSAEAVIMSAKSYAAANPNLYNGPQNAPSRSFLNYFVHTDELPLYESVSPNSSVVATLKYGEEVQVLETTNLSYQEEIAPNWVITNNFVKIQTISGMTTGYVKGIYLSRLKPISADDNFSSIDKNLIMETYFSKKYVLASDSTYQYCLKKYVSPFLTYKTDSLRARYKSKRPNTVTDYIFKGVVGTAYNRDIKALIPYCVVAINKKIQAAAPNYDIRDIDSSAVYTEFLNTVPIHEAYLLANKLFNLKKSDWNYNANNNSLITKDGKLIVSSKIERVKWYYGQNYSDLNLVRIQRNLW